jgi:hypothetical protein
MIRQLLRSIRKADKGIYPVLFLYKTPVVAADSYEEEDTIGVFEAVNPLLTL